MREIVIRRAVTQDAADIARIYNHYIRTSTVTFDTLEKSVDERVEWVAAHDERHAVLVALQREQIAAWGAVSAWGDRPGWRHTVELSVYVDPDSLGAGVGRTLVEALIGEARTAGHHVLLAQIVEDNAASLAMAERAGFRRVGVMREVGRKFDRWLDVVIMERIVDPGEARGV